MVLPMGLTTSTHICQRIMTAVMGYLGVQGHWIMNYIDDIAGCDTAQKAQEAYQALADTVTHWGMREALDKAVPPCTKC